MQEKLAPKVSKAAWVMSKNYQVKRETDRVAPKTDQVKRETDRVAPKTSGKERN
ncbi:hypothetical protein ACIQ7N_20000 [Lysinibacillus sp. NPDC095746]|uniref:hypothetical protein n=1 Tax=Lysinibacillus sp. NPDC095746 TaxID=3364134 RepID=UPI00382E15C5